MKKIEEHKAAVLKFYSCISGNKKHKEQLSRFTYDHKLMNHILYFETLIPAFNIYIDEVTAEENRVCVKARYHGKQTGKINGNDPTNQEIEFPLAIGFHIASGKITDHWIIGDQITLLEQLKLV